MQNDENSLITIHPCILFFIDFESMLASFHKTTFLPLYIYIYIYIYVQVYLFSKKKKNNIDKFLSS